MWPLKKNSTVLPFPYRIQTPFWILIQVVGFNRIQDAALLFPIPKKRFVVAQMPPCCLDLLPPKTSVQLGIKVTCKMVRQKKTEDVWTKYHEQKSYHLGVHPSDPDVCCATGWRLKSPVYPFLSKLTVQLTTQSLGWFHHFIGQDSLNLQEIRWFQQRNHLEWDAKNIKRCWFHLNGMIEQFLHILVQARACVFSEFETSRAPNSSKPCHYLVVKLSRKNPHSQHHVTLAPKWRHIFQGFGEIS